MFDWDPNDDVDPTAAAELDMESAADGTRREDEPGDYVIADFDGECSRNVHCYIFPGDTIRADGDGGWECRGCVDKDPVAALRWVRVIAPGHRCRLGGEHIPAGSAARFDGEGWECRSCVEQEEVPRENATMIGCDIHGAFEEYCPNCEWTAEDSATLDPDGTLADEVLTEMRGER